MEIILYTFVHNDINKLFPIKSKIWDAIKAMKRQLRTDSYASIKSVTSPFVESVTNTYIILSEIAKAKEKERPITFEWFTTDFSRANLSKIELQNVDMSNTDFANANFTNANLKRSVFANANFTNANLEGTDLMYADLRGCKFLGSHFLLNLISTNLRHANLMYANLQKCDFSGAYLKGANLIGANFKEANFSYADLEGALFLPSLTDFLAMPLTTQETPLAKIHQRLHEIQNMLHTNFVSKFDFRSNFTVVSAIAADILSKIDNPNISLPEIALAKALLIGSAESDMPSIINHPIFNVLDNHYVDNFYTFYMPRNQCEKEIYFLKTTLENKLSQLEQKELELQQMQQPPSNNRSGISQPTTTQTQRLCPR